MKIFYSRLAALAALLVSATACSDLFRQERTGTLHITFISTNATSTRASGGQPDTDTFLLTVSDAAGQIFYDGTFANAPDELTVPEGNYTVSAVSAPFETPAFDAPQWGDTQVVSVSGGANVSVNLVCRQLNSGLCVEVAASFREAFPTGALTLDAAEGSLPFPYGETRTAYFRPGPVSISLHDGAFEQRLLTRNLEACQILSLRLSASVGAKSGGIAIQVDTARSWLSDQYVYGAPGGQSPEEAYEVGTARERAGESGVWVRGYIVGVATGSGKVTFAPPFTKNTNLILGAKASTTDIGYCLSVELKSGKIRDALNLQDHPELLGRRLYIRGDLVSAYYGIPGLKAPTEYRLDE